MTTTDVMKYLKPGAIVPVDVQTTALLVNALREALASQGEALASEAIEQPAQQEEPVAWVYELIVDGDICQVDCTTVNWNPEYQPFGRAGINFKDGGKVTKTPLYASPPTLSLAQRQARSADTWVNATTWRGLTDEEIDQGLLRSDYAFKTAEAWRAGVVFAMTKLKEKNCG